MLLTPQLLLRVSLAPRATARALCPSGALTAQPAERVSISASFTGIKFGERWGGITVGVATNARIKLLSQGAWSAGIRASVVGPIAISEAVPDCVPDVPCYTYRTPDALLGASGDFGVSTRNRKLRVSVGAGFVSAVNLKGNSGTNSPTGEASVEYSILPTRRVSPSISFRLQHLARGVAGVRTLVLPGVGIVF